MIVDCYHTLDEMNEICGDEFNINIVHIIGRDGILHNTDDLTSYYAVYACEVDHKNYSVSIYVGMSKKVIENIINDIKPLHGSFNAVSVEEMVEYFHSIDQALQFIECGKRCGLLESCGSGFYAY